jgi:hypothetical protein
MDADIERSIAEHDIPQPPLARTKRPGRLLFAALSSVGGLGIVTSSRLVMAVAGVVMLGVSCGRGAGPDAPAQASRSAAQPRPTVSAEAEPELIDDDVISVRPKRVRSGETMTLAISKPPGDYGLAWFLDRKSGSDWTYIGGFRAGPPNEWKEYHLNRFYFLPEWRNVGIESVAFSGSNRIELAVPDLQPGTYRIAGSFLVRHEEEWHVEVFKVVKPGA